MAYLGYLLKVGTYEITGEKFINYESYDVTREIQDLDAHRDATGKLHRNVLPNIPIKINFETRPGLNNDEVAEFLGNISSNYTNALERKAVVRAFVPELNDYIEQDMYMAGPTLKIKRIDANTNQVFYNSFKVTFIGY